METFDTKYGPMTCYSNDVVFISALRDGKLYEEDLILKVMPHLRDAKLIVDIGSHIGTHSMIYSTLDCKVLAFEPQLHMYELLKKNVPKCMPYHMAIGHKTMTTTLSSHLYDGYDCPIEYNTSTPFNYGGIGLGMHGEKVYMTTIDSLRLERCDYMKLDVEGSEILVLMGAKETIQKYKPLIWFEHTDKRVTEEMKQSLGIDFDLEEVSTFLSSMGYQFISLNEYNQLAYIPQEIDLSTKEYTIYSESGEDGILSELFRLYGTTNRYYVEFGAADGSQCNTRLLKENGFHGILMDMHYSNPDIQLYQETVTCENVIDLFKKYNVPLSFDLLSLDIDSYDYYVLDELLKVYTPRIFVCEYNATHLPHEDKVVLKNSQINHNYFGASILSFYKLAQRHHYSLVYANEKGVNLFFVHNDLFSIYTTKDRNNVDSIYRLPKYGNGPNGGHPSDLYNQPYTTSQDV